MQNKYGFGKTVALAFDAAVERVTQELAKEGFGVLTDIDMQATMKKKLDHDMPPYRILGACNPPAARQMVTVEPSVGLLLPCNVVVRQDDRGAVHVEFLDPAMMVQLIDAPQAAAIAAEVKGRLVRVMDAL
jgi:uncharacterized protein (DUF302 family)